MPIVRPFWETQGTESQVSGLQSVQGQSIQHSQTPFFKKKSEGRRAEVGMLLDGSVFALGSSLDYGIQRKRKKTVQLARMK